MLIKLHQLHQILHRTISNPKLCLKIYQNIFYVSKNICKWKPKIMNINVVIPYVK